MMELKKLKEPFLPEDIEWRVQSSGKDKNGKQWALVLAYVTARAIMDRLDEVCGLDGWQNDFKDSANGGTLCGISIKCGDEWVTKWDGSGNTDIEAVKGGLSGAMKRAGSQWGIGRYLYNIPTGWAVINANGSHKDKAKDGTTFKWNPPQLPKWALPDGYNPADGAMKNLKAADEARQTHEDAPEAHEDDVKDFINTAQLKVVDGYLERLSLNREGLGGWLVSKKKLSEPDITKMTQEDATAMVRKWDDFSSDIVIFCMNQKPGA